MAALWDVAKIFSPRVAKLPSGEVCFDLSGLEQLFPNQDKLACAILGKVEALGLSAQLGIGSTRFVARLAARTIDGYLIVEPGEERSFLGPLPISLLEASANIQAWLERFGIETLGQLAALPSSGLGPRLGPEGLRLWRLAQGRDNDNQPQLYDPSPERFVEEYQLLEPVCRLESLFQVLHAVFVRLAARLEIRGLSAKRLFLSLELEPLGKDERIVELASASREVKSWLAVVRVLLEKQPPSDPVGAVSLEAEVEGTRFSQMDFFAPSGPPPAKLDETLVRLTALLGEERVGSPKKIESYNPGDFEVVPYRQRRLSNQPLPVLERKIIVRLLRPPWPVEVEMDGKRLVYLRSKSIQGRVLAYAGPWRLATTWWAERALSRDYYEVELSDGGVYRLFKVHEPVEWYLDGVGA
jgi:protein ImuB